MWLKFKFLYFDQSFIHQVVMIKLLSFFSFFKFGHVTVSSAPFFFALMSLLLKTKNTREVYMSCGMAGNRLLMVIGFRLLTPHSSSS